MSKHYVLKGVLVMAVYVLIFASLSYAADEKGKIPITTSSEEALTYFLQGRDIFEKLRAQESLQFLEKAITADPDFAMCYLYFSLAQPSAKGFFEQLNKAVALVEKVSEGERLWILGLQAGVNGDPMKQKEYYKKLVATYPNDERAHNLLGGYYFGQQKYALAIEEYNKATKINPNFSQPYNQLGYANRFLEKYKDAEDAFKKYIQLIPDDPNPYDSYAELLLKIGKYDESIKYYKKALTVNPNFVASHIGIATNLNYQRKHVDARKQLMKLYDITRNDGERRQTHFATAVSYVDQGKFDSALEELEKQYALAEKINDAAAMAGDLGIMGNILLEIKKYDQAEAKFKKSVQLIEGSNLAEEVKNNARRNFLFNAARVALKKKDLVTAKAKAKEFRKQVEAQKNTFQIWLSHQIAGMIALEEKAFDKAVAEFQQANLQNPYNLYKLSLAFKGKGDKVKAKEFFTKAINYNGLNSLNNAFVRFKTQK